MIFKKKYLYLSIFLFIGIISWFIFKNYLIIEPLPDIKDPFEIENGTVYGIFKLDEKIDGDRSGLVTHDLYLILDNMESKTFSKKYNNQPFNPSNYEQLTWKTLKKTILDESENYVGKDNILDSFREKYIDKKIRISGKIYKHCFDTFYIQPKDEIEPKESFTCLGISEQYHIRLSGYPGTNNNND